VKCDVRVWEDQVALFEASTRNSPHKSCDIVIGNAGIAVPDALVVVEGRWLICATWTCISSRIDITPKILHFPR
jgi:hypothetical protein